MWIRLGIGKKAGEVVDMLPHQAHGVEANGTGHILTPSEVADHAVALARIAEVEAESLVGTAPTPMAAIRQRNVDARRLF